MSSDKYRFEEDDTGYAVGLGYISSVLKNVGHEVKMLSFTKLSVTMARKNFFSKYEEFKPDIVGFSVFSPNRISSFKTIEELYCEANPPHIIIGGIHTTVMYEKIIEKFPKIIAVLGEGERTIVELVKAIENNLELSIIKGLAYYKDGKVFLTERRELIEDLDTLPFPDHDVFFKLSPSRTTGSIITSRGCPSKCSFCSLDILSRNIVRKRSVENVMEEIKFLKQKYPKLKNIIFLDDALLLDNKRVIKLCKLLIEGDLGLTFACEARVKPVSRELFYWMKKAGFTYIIFGLETAADELMKSIGKGITKIDVLNLMDMIKPFNFRILFFVMCGFPGENRKTIQETADFVNSIQKKQYVQIWGVSKLYAFPGTRIYENMKNASCIDDEYWMTESEIPYYTVEHSFKELLLYERFLSDRILLKDCFTVSGFCRHFLKMPIEIMKFLLRNKEEVITPIDVSLKRYVAHYYWLVYKRLSRRINTLEKYEQYT